MRSLPDYHPEELRVRLLQQSAKSMLQDAAPDLELLLRSAMARLGDWPLRNEAISLLSSLDDARAKHKEAEESWLKSNGPARARKAGYGSV